MKIIIVGSGRMGTLIKELAEESGDQVVLTVDENNISELNSLEKISDVIIDFSSPKSLSLIVQYAKKTFTPLVSGTTGYSVQEMEFLKSLSEEVAILYSANYSFGVAVMRKMLEDISKSILENGFDVELIEAHHNKKVDSPSGTAKLLMNAIDPNEELAPIYGRVGMCGVRDRKEFGIHSIRGGTVAGTHSVTFWGEDESIELIHTATSRRIFALGALSAARKIKNKSKGLYTFDEIMF